MRSGLLTQPVIALTELIANAWGTGATEVRITIPEKKGELLVVQDNGCGLTKQEFIDRWMTLSYDRNRHQGNVVIMPDGTMSKRKPYGRNRF